VTEQKSEILGTRQPGLDCSSLIATSATALMAIRLAIE
jgi:hypothetical protein